jgi:outer membrane protein insertion porin family
MKSRIARIAVVIALLMATAQLPALWAQTLDGLPIREIVYEGLESLTEDTLNYYLGLAVGETYDDATLNEKVHALWGRNLVDDIQIETSEADGGVRLTVTIQERPILRSIEYEGLKRISRSDINEKVISESIRVREGDSLSLGELHRLKAAIEELYAEKGFRLAEANYTIEEASRSDRRVVYTIDEGDKVRVGEIDFEGNTVFKDMRLSWAMSDTKKSNLITKVLKKDIYSPASLSEDLEAVRELYLKAGYKNVVLGEPKIEVKPVKGGEAADPEVKRRLFITIPVEEGDRWKLGEITIEGSDRFPAEVLLRQFEKSKGGWLRSKVIDDGLETIRELYSNTGHLFAQIEPEIVEKPDQVADVIIHVDEGEQFRIGRIEFSGNTKTKDKVLRRDMSIQEGLVMNTGALKNSLLRIGQSEVFKVDEEDPVSFDIDSEEKFVDLTIQGEEGERTEMLFGGGFSEIDGFFGQFQFRTRNFLGRGETLGVSAQLGARQDIFDLSYFIPWFLNRPQSFGASIFKRRLDYNLLTGQTIFQDNFGGTLTYGRNIGIFGNFSTTFSRYDSDEARSEFDLEGNKITQQINRKVAMLRWSVVRDRRDSRLQPTFGSRATVSLDLAGGPLGGNTDFWRPQASYSKFLPMTKGRIRTVLGLNASAGYIEPIGDTPLYFNDRFYLGGENSVRGFKYRSIWVRDSEGNTVTDLSGFPLGGNRSIQLNIEAIFVLKGPFRFLLYTDGGKVYGDDQDLDFQNFRISSGAELQVTVPMLGAPLRFIYAYNLSPLPDDRFETFQFSIGPSF